MSAAAAEPWQGSKTVIGTVINSNNYTRGIKRKSVQTYLFYYNGKIKVCQGVIMVKKLLIFLLAVPMWGQVLVGYIASTGSVTLNSAATAATLQQPATNSVNVGFPKAQSGGLSTAGASIYCSVTCTATLSRNCTTPATATAGSVVQINPTDPPPTITFWTSSNASGCTTLEIIPIGAGLWQGVDLSLFSLYKGGTTSNLTLSIGSITGTAIITFYPVEQH